MFNFPIKRTRSATVTKSSRRRCRRANPISLEVLETRQLLSATVAGAGNAVSPVANLDPPGVPGHDW